MYMYFINFWDKLDDMFVDDRKWLYMILLWLEIVFVFKWNCFDVLYKVVVGKIREYDYCRFFRKVGWVYYN